MRIPNLFTRTEESRRLYSLMLARLDIHDRNEDVVKAARVIRRHACNSGDVRAGLFTYWFERDALWYLERHSVGWDQQLRFETGWHGQPVDLFSNSVEDVVRYQVAEQRAPLHYACGRFSEAGVCQEMILSLGLSKLKSDDFLYGVTNCEETPTHPVRVTLRHIYEAQGKSLIEWADWTDFVSGLSQPLLRRAGVSRKSLRADAGLLKNVDEAIVQRRSKKPQRQSMPRDLKSPWEEELLRWFPFLQELPRN